MSAKECVIPVFVPHLGCPQSCVFCDQIRISGEQNVVHGKYVAKIIEQSVALYPQGLKRQLAFYGGSFTAIHLSHQLELLGVAKSYIERGLIDEIRLSTRPDCIDENILERLKSYGVKTIELGAQSMDEDVLNATRRGHTAKDVEVASKLIKKHGFRLILQMMTGLPKSDDATDIMSAKSIADLEPDGVRIYPTVIVNNSELCDLWKSGEYKEHSVEDAVRVCAEIVPIFEDKGIDIIRLGLNPSDDLSNGEAVAGAYHPALGELVRSRIMLHKAEKILDEIQPCDSVCLGVNGKLISQLIGQKGANRKALCEKYGLKELKVQSVNRKDREIELVHLVKAR